MAGHVVADVVHLLAELIENATVFSPPTATVKIGGSPIANGYVLEIEDCGLGMSDEQLIRANERIASPPAVDFGPSPLLGLQVVGKLGQRHGIKVQLRHSWYGGVTALVLLPVAITVGLESQETLIVANQPERPLPPSSDPSTGTRLPPLFDQPRSDWSDAGIGGHPAEAAPLPGPEEGQAPTSQEPPTDLAPRIFARRAAAFAGHDVPQPAAPPRRPGSPSEWETLSSYHLGLQHGRLTTRRGDARR